MPGTENALNLPMITDKLLEEAAELLRAYFRIEIEGLHHVPRSGKALIVPNHSGYAAADAIMVCHLIHRELGRVPKILAHHAFFDFLPFASYLFRALGLERVSVKHGVELLEKGEMVLVFPEGEAGNFKSSLKRYHLQPFHTGSVRMSIMTGAPLVPCLVVGAEESHLNLGSIDASPLFKGLRLPVPLNLIPLPAKWKIRFLPPLTCSGDARDLTRQLQITMQRELNHELERRESIFLP
jgi:1-acyl-sn-glycerol-3-phosphate acyltransferase